jgi:hypothetical protein
MKNTEKDKLRGIIKSCVEDVWYGRRTMNPIENQTNLLMKRLLSIIESYANDYHKSKLAKVTDQDIEQWAKNNSISDVTERSMISGAKAMRNGEIKQYNKNNT